MEREIVLSRQVFNNPYSGSGRTRQCSVGYVALVTNGTCDITGRTELCVRTYDTTDDGGHVNISLAYLNEKAQQHGLV